MHFDHIAIGLHVTAGGTVQFHQALHRGVGGDIGQFHFNGILSQARMYHAEGHAIVRFGLGHGFRLGFALDGKAKVKLLRSTGDQFAQGKAGLVGLAHFEGSFGGDEAHRLGPVPLDVSLQGGLEAE